MATILALLLKYRYIVLFPLVAIEGPFVAILVGFLVFSGVLNLWISFGILMLGEVIPDTVYYSIGYFGGKTKFIEERFLRSKFFINHMDAVNRLWQEHTFKTLFFGKLAYGMALPFIVSAGIVKVPYRKFITYAFPISVFQYTVLTFAGYYLGSSYAVAATYANYAYLLLGALVVLFIGGYFVAIKYARKKVIDLERTEEHK